MTEAYLCTGRRSAIGRFGGALAQTRPDDLLAHVIRATLADVPTLDPSAIDDVIMGCANQAGEDNRNVARMAALLAGLPESVAGVTLNRLCGSGLDAIAMGARAIKAGEAEIILAGGVESMTRAPMVMPKAESAFSRKAEIFDTTIGWRFVNREMKARILAYRAPIKTPLPTAASAARPQPRPQEDLPGKSSPSRCRNGAATRSSLTLMNTRAQPAWNNSPASPPRFGKMARSQPAMARASMMGPQRSSSPRKPPWSALASRPWRAFLEQPWPGSLRVLWALALRRPAKSSCSGLG
jgi:hypothetical protein